MSKTTIVTNKQSGKSIEHLVDQLGEIFLTVSKYGHGCSLIVEGFDPDDFRTLADYLDKIRNVKGEI